MRTGTRLRVCVLVVAAAACSRAPLKPVVTVPAGPTSTERLAAADRLVRAGCLDCLLDAHHEYQALRSISSAGHAATMGAIRTAGLIALRQRELGMVDEGYIAIAKALSSTTPDLPAWVGGTLDSAAVLGGSIAGVTRPPVTDIDLERLRVVRTTREAYTTLLREFSPIDELAAYTWATFMCGSIEMRDVPAAEIFAAVATFRETPLLQFKEASCRGLSRGKLESLIAATSWTSRARSSSSRSSVTR